MIDACPNCGMPVALDDDRVDDVDHDRYSIQIMWSKTNSSPLMGVYSKRGDAERVAKEIRKKMRGADRNAHGTVKIVRIARANIWQSWSMRRP